MMKIEGSDPDPDPLVRSVDPRIWIRIHITPKCHGSVTQQKGKNLEISCFEELSKGLELF
jgi:hypothetical protein